MSGRRNRTIRRTENTAVLEQEKDHAEKSRVKAEREKKPSKAKKGEA